MCRTQPGLHVVFTHFLLGEGHLRNVALTAFKLFRALTFPSMMQQTTHAFVWIVYVDSDLVPEVHQLLAELMHTRVQVRRCVDRELDGSNL